jgi:hypothetical protein
MKGKRMNREVAKKKLGEILKKEMIKELQHLYIKQDKYGTYTLFNEYRIKQDSDNYFQITNKCWERPKTFGSIRSAVSFTVLHKHNNINPAKELETLDSKLSSVDVELQMHKILLNKARDLDTFFIFQTKIQNDTDKRQYILKELRKHINSSKRFQDSLFDQKLQKDKDLKFRKRR